MFRFAGPKRPVRAVAFAPDGGLLAAAGDDRTVRVWHRDGTVVREFDGHGGPVYAVAFHPDGSLLASGGSEQTVDDNLIRLWDLQDTDDHESLPARLRDYLSGRGRPVIRWGSYPIHALTFLRRGEELVASCRDEADEPRNEAWQILSGQAQCLRFRTTDPAPDVRRTWLDVRASVCAVAVAADADMVAVASRQYVRVGRLDAARVPPGYAAKGDVWALALSPSGDQLAGCWGNRVTVWQTAGGAEVREFAGHAGPVRALAYRPDGSALASGGKDGTVLVWEPVSGMIRAVYDWGLGPIHALAFSPDGLTLAVAGDGGLTVVDFE